MKGCSEDAWERVMKVQKAILRATAKRIIRLGGPEMIGIADRSRRRCRERYDEYGYDGLLDGRRGSQPQSAQVQMGILTCQERPGETPGLVKNKSSALL
jgi:hypothetical protein